MKNLFPYPGGKYYMAGWIREFIPDHECYVEPFGGSACLLLNKEPSKVDVYNDLDGDIVQFFDVLRERPDELREWLRKVPYAKDIHDRWADMFYSGERFDDPVKRAGVFYFLRISQFAGKYKTKSGFGTSKQRNEARTYQRKVDQLEWFADRLSQVQIENRDYGDLVERYDGSDTFWYFDPPYVEEGDDLYRHGEFDQDRFVETLHSIEGRWLCSYTDIPDGLTEYQIIERGMEQRMNMGHSDEDRSTSRTERLVMNFDPDEVPTFAGADQSNLEAFAGADD